VLAFQPKEADMFQMTESRRVVALAAFAVVALVGAAPASAKTYTVSGKQTVVDEDKGVYKMRGGLKGRWVFTKFEEAPIANSPYYHAQGTEVFEGCLDRRRDRSCKGDPKGSLSFTFDYWALFDSPDPASLVWGACSHPIVSGTGDFAGARGVIVFADTRVKSRYIGNLTLNGHGAAGAARTAAASRNGC
jgi:hypothetical protein